MDIEVVLFILGNIALISAMLIPVYDFINSRTK